jgi:hypothetical protein
MHSGWRREKKRAHLREQRHRQIEFRPRQAPEASEHTVIKPPNNQTPATTMLLHPLRRVEAMKQTWLLPTRIEAIAEGEPYSADR